MKLLVEKGKLPLKLQEMLGNKSTEHRPHSQAKWQPPDEGMVNVNFDAAYEYQTRKGGTGVVARDKDGLVVATKAVQFAAEMGFTNIIIQLYLYLIE
ncbi:hypothetical protein DITRI_Ditri17bG0022400 [Diplodiscus trichospermus]